MIIQNIIENIREIFWKCRHLDGHKWLDFASDLDLEFDSAIF